jgi:peptidyl-prolyl cis-trans isomerase SurA
MPLLWFESARISRARAEPATASANSLPLAICVAAFLLIVACARTPAASPASDTIRPILLSEIHHRAKPYLLRLSAKAGLPGDFLSRESQVYAELLNKIADERLEERAADRAHVSVSRKEIDDAIQMVSKSGNLDPSALVQEAKRQGLSEQDYRDEIRRNILEGKLLRLRTHGGVAVTDVDTIALYDRLVRDRSLVRAEVRVLTLGVPETIDPARARARMVAAEEIVARAHNGEDFCKLVAEYSDDQATVVMCGASGPVEVAALRQPVRDAIVHLKPGEVAGPLNSGTSTRDHAILVVQLVSAPHIPNYDEVRDEMRERAFHEALDHERTAWLDELRRGAKPEVINDMRPYYRLPAEIRSTDVVSTVPAFDQKVLRLPPTPGL